MIRKTAKTAPTPALARTRSAGIPKAPTAIPAAESKPARAATRADALSEASNPSGTRTGTAAAKVEPGQKFSGSSFRVQTVYLRGCLARCEGSSRYVNGREVGRAWPIGTWKAPLLIS